MLASRTLAAPHLQLGSAQNLWWRSGLGGTWRVTSPLASCGILQLSCEACDVSAPSLSFLLSESFSIAFHIKKVFAQMDREGEGWAFLYRFRAVQDSGGCRITFARQPLRP